MWDTQISALPSSPTVSLRFSPHPDRKSTDRCFLYAYYGNPQSAADEAIDGTLLHEIAHALIGKTHGHDQVWQAQAVVLGCAGQRCHNVQFTPPRYIVTCENACWVTTAERRQRGAVCRTCHGQVRYTTYTEARWQAASQRRGA